ncbi:MAG: polysaccharide biosynthesis tyrosine autokinase [Pseudomonadota bacterium]
MQAQNLPASLNAQTEDSIDFLHLLQVVLRSWRSIIGLAIVVSLLTFLWVMRIEPVYRASTTIMIESEMANTVSIEEVYGLPSRMREYFLTQFQIIKNRDIAEAVADELDLWNNPKFAGPVGGGQPVAPGLIRRIKTWLDSVVTLRGSKPPPKLDAEEVRRAAVINRFMANLRVTPVEFTQLVVVSFESTDRQLAADIVNTLARVYIQSQLDAKLESTREAGTWLASRLEDLKLDLETSQQALQEFRDQESILDLAGGTTLAQQELNELTTRLGDARRARIGAENIHRELGGSSDYSVAQLMSMPAVLQHPLVQSLAQSQAEAQQEATNLAKRYGPEHPKMVIANSRRVSSRSELEEQVLQVVTGIEKEYRVARRNEENLAERLAVVKAEVALLNRKEFRLRGLEQQVETDRRLYEMFFNRARETSETMGFQAAHARVVEKAATPLSPIKPDRQRIVMIAFGLSLLAGMGLAILRDQLDTTLSSADDVHQHLHAPLLGVIPNTSLPRGHKGPFLGYLQDVNSQFAEAIRNIRTGLVLSGQEQPQHVVLVTSTNPGEGKSTVAINLAVALAQMETVLLVDADLRRPSVSAAFGLPSQEVGLTDVLEGAEDIEKCIVGVDAGFDILPAGSLPANPQELLSTAQFARLLERLSGSYQRVIIDSAPVNAVSDSLILATRVDSLVYVSLAEATPHKLVRKSLNLLRDKSLPLTGVVLNGVREKNQASYYAGGYYTKPYGG